MINAIFINNQASSESVLNAHWILVERLQKRLRQYFKLIFENNSEITTLKKSWNSTLKKYMRILKKYMLNINKTLRKQ
jgi:hypothetical protein